MTVATIPPLLTLPSELIHHVLTFLPLSDLLSVGLVNRALQEHSRQDTLYQSFVQSHVPGPTVRKPANISWRDLFKLHYPYWFIPKNKIWFADNEHTGKLLIARYDYRLNAIEAYALVAERRQPTFQTWEWNPQAIIHTFRPRIQLDLNVPVVRLDANGYENATGDVRHRLQKEIPMNPFSDSPRYIGRLYSRLLLTKPWPTEITSEATPVWPPLILPSPMRTRNDDLTQFQDPSHGPSTWSELSTANFRLRKWIEFSSRQPGGVTTRIGEDITTWATLPEECYTPTPQKPWQGIWCGDYAGHGCEFLVIMQPDDPKPLPRRVEWAMRARECQGSVSSAGSWSTASTDATTLEEGEQVEVMSADLETNNLEDSVATLQATVPEQRLSPSTEEHLPEKDESIYQGRIEAVKLTGDPNIPRGEYTFIAPDIGPNGLIRVATEDMFKGARIVKSVGHNAASGFRNDEYTASQLILISPDRIAQYWETFGHVSFYQRVHIDAFIKVP